MEIGFVRIPTISKKDALREVLVTEMHAVYNTGLYSPQKDIMGFCKIVFKFKMLTKKVHNPCLRAPRGPEAAAPREPCSATWRPVLPREGPWCSPSAISYFLFMRPTNN